MIQNTDLHDFQNRFINVIVPHAKIAKGHAKTGPCNIKYCCKHSNFTVRLKKYQKHWIENNISTDKQTNTELLNPIAVVRTATIFLQNNF